MNQKQLYLILYKRLKNIDSDLAETFADRCFENEDYINLQYRKNTFKFTITKKNMVDDYFFWLNEHIDSLKKQITEINHIMREDEIAETEEWFVFNEETEEWE